MKEKFDMQKAREICELLRIAYPSTVTVAANMLPAALDRIEEMEKQTMHDCISCRAEAYREGKQAQATRIANLEADRRVKTVIINNRDDERRITELETENTRLQDALIAERTIRILDGEEKFALAKVDNCPHTRKSCDDDCSFDWCPSKEFWMSIARDQLEKEGLL